MLELLTKITDSVDNVLAGIASQYQSPGWLYDPVRYVIEGGGKRVRPLLTVLACQAVGGKFEHAIHAATGVEVLHNFTLVHDDIMDSSPIRRGRPTVHLKWTPNTAILAGDVMIGIAFDLLCTSAANSSNPLDVIRAFNQGLIDVCDGQALDMELSEKSDVHEDEYFDMIERKTARLLEMAMVVGGHIGNAQSDAIEHLRLFARNLGVAFQLQDDVLDLIGSPAFGKTPGGDIIEGKQTLIMIRARNAARRSQNAEYIDLMGRFVQNRGLPADQVPAVVSMVTSLGILHDIKSQIGNLTNEAFAHLDTLPHSEAKEELRGIAISLIDRTV